MNNPVQEQVSRCVELYADVIDADLSQPITREQYEQLRTDLLLLAGMTSALLTFLKAEEPST